MKKQGIKKIIIMFLCICFSMTGLYIPTFGKEQTDGYKKRVIERFWDSFEVDDGVYYETLVNTGEYSYIQWADALENKNNLEKAFLWATNFLLDKKMNTEAYVNYLTTILSMMDVGMEESTWEQASYTAEKNVSDFAGETFQMGLEEFLGKTTYARLNDSYKIFFDVKEIADLASVTITDTTQLYVYSVASASYEKKRTFLEELGAYTDDKKLKKATEQVLQVIDLEFSYIMLNYADDFIFDTINLGMDVSGVSWIEDVNPALCKMVSENLAPWLAEHGKTKLSEGALFVSNAVKKYGAKVGLFVQSVLLTGKVAALVVGDDVEMYREIQVMDAMSDALTKALHDYNNQVTKGSIEKQYENVYKYVVMGEALTYVHTRGEYCVSEIRRKQGENPAVSGKEYMQQAEKYQKAYDILTKILPDPEQYVVTEGFALTDGFIVEVIQRNSVPDGYIGIYDFADLMAMRENPDGNYILMNDIVCGEYEFKETTFTGTLDGNGYKISNINNPLFRILEGGVVKNLGMQADAAIDFTEEGRGNYDISGWGALACQAKDDFVVNNCYVEGVAYLVTDYDSFSMGGIFGGCIADDYPADARSLLSCYSKIDIVAEYGFGIVYAGGLVGSYSSDRAKDGGATNGFENCFNEGNIVLTAKGGSADGYAGGICGDCDDCDIIGCYNTGDVKITVGKETTNLIVRDNAWLKAGGIVGNIGGSIDINKIENCWNSGNITAKSQNALLEKNEEDVYRYEMLADRICAGGIVGKCYYIGIYKCFNKGQVDGRLYSGGIVGAYMGQPEDSWVEWEPHIDNCYNIGDIKGNYLAGGIIGLLEDGGCVHNCYTIGNVSEEAILGGQFAGYLSLEAEYENCFYLSNGKNKTTGTTYMRDAIKELGKAEFRSKDTYEGYDFYGIWEFDEDDSVTPAKLRF